MGVHPFHFSDKFDPSDFKIKPKASKPVASQASAEDAGQGGDASSTNSAAPEKVTTNGPSKAASSGSKVVNSGRAWSVGGAKADAVRAGTSRPKRSLRELLPAACAMFSMKVSCGGVCSSQCEVGLVACSVVVMMCSALCGVFVGVEKM